MDGSEFPEVEKARRAFKEGRSLDLEFRLRQLSRLEELLDDEDNRQILCEAIHKDLRKGAAEFLTMELFGVKKELQAVQKHFRKATTTKELPKNLFLIKDQALIRRQPHGVVLIIATWNYPIILCLKPLIGAIAAGNCCIIKASEISEHTSLVIAKLLPKYLDNNCYHVVLGDPDRTQRLLTHRFDHIFFTGSTAIGKQILKAAALHLTPCTLELGGKSPVYIDESVDMEIAVKRLLWGKLLNMGQTCIAPDYILCSSKVQSMFVFCARIILKEFYGTYINNSKDLARLVSPRHFHRVRKMLEATKGLVMIGGEMDEEDLYIEPTIVADVKADDSLMREEIFGPIFPMVEVKSAQEAINFINDRERPLALYIFTKNEKAAQHIIESTISGSVCVNDVIFQVANLQLPFGGTGNSGMGQYSGKYSIKAFSFKRSILKRNFDFISEAPLASRYPPSHGKKIKTIEKLVMLQHKFELDFGPYVNYFLAALFGYYLCVFLSYVENLGKLIKIP